MCKKSLFTLQYLSYHYSLWQKVFPPVDADVGVNQPEEADTKVSIEDTTDDSKTTESSSDVDSKKKPKKEKIGFRDRKV